MRAACSAFTAMLTRSVDKRWAWIGSSTFRTTPSAKEPPTFTTESVDHSTSAAVPAATSSASTRVLSAAVSSRVGRLSRTG